MVALSQRMAEEAGVADKAKFVRGDMYEADLSQATALIGVLDGMLKLAAEFH